MSFLPTIKSIRKEDLGADAPTWVDNLLTPLNSFIESVYTILNKNLSFTDNINCRIFEYTFSTKTNYNSGGWDNINISVKLTNKINGCILLSVNNLTDTATVSTTAKTIEWEEQPNTCRIKFITGLANSTKYKIKVLII